jgi:type I restriction enzyme S subunit
MEKDLPKNWIKLSIKDIAKTKSGGTPSTSVREYWNGNIPWINSGMLKGTIITEYSKLITERGLNESSANLFPVNTVVIALTGVTTGKVGLLGIETSTNQSITGILPNKTYNSKFLFYQLKSLRSIILKQALGTAQPHINKAIVDNLELVIPSLAQQHHIVAKLDALFVQYEAMKKALERIPKLLKYFRQEVLTHAVTGKLTEQWREGQMLNAYSFEELNKFRAEAKSFDQNNKGKSKLNYKMSNEVKFGNNTKGIDSLYDIPNSWSWVNLDQVTWNISDGPHFSPKYVLENEGKKFISMRNVSVKGIDFSNCQYVSLDDHNQYIRRGKPELGDILYTKGGSTGIACLLDRDIDFSYWVHIALLKVVKKAVNPIFLKNALNSPLCYKQSQSFTHGVGNQDLGLTRMIYITFPLPPLLEQQEIAASVERIFAKADKIEERYNILKAKIKVLPQSILHKAFQGELIEQLPIDENVRELLQEVQNLS